MTFCINLWEFIKNREAEQGDFFLFLEPAGFQNSGMQMENGEKDRIRIELRSRDFLDNRISISHNQLILNDMQPTPSPNVTDRLGQRYLILENGFKPYASGVVTHPLIDALVALRNERLKAEKIERIDLRVNLFVLQVTTGQLEPQTDLEGKFSP